MHWQAPSIAYTGHLCTADKRVMQAVTPQCQRQAAWPGCRAVLRALCPPAKPPSAIAASRLAGKVALSTLLSVVEFLVSKFPLLFQAGFQGVFISNLLRITLSCHRQAQAQPAPPCEQPGTSSTHHRRPYADNSECAEPARLQVAVQCTTSALCAYPTRRDAIQQLPALVSLVMGVAALCGPQTPTVLSELHYGCCDLLLGTVITHTTPDSTHTQRGADHAYGTYRDPYQPCMCVSADAEHQLLLLSLPSSTKRAGGASTDSKATPNLAASAGPSGDTADTHVPAFVGLSEWHSRDAPSAGPAGDPAAGPAAGGLVFSTHTGQLVATLDTYEHICVSEGSTSFCHICSTHQS